ncbi:MAG: copper resistance protein CopC [Actinomycetia bacterium]|nr:copper resistance protein CopC [Actinomycetes bacterium]
MTAGATLCWTSRLAAATFVAALTLLPVTAASAHSELVESTPADGAELKQAPTQVQLVFDEAIQQQGGDIVVSVRASTVSDATTFATEANVATIGLTGPAQPGSYTVKYRIVSADGHIGSGTFGYSVTGTSPASPDATTSPPQDAGDTGDTGNSGDSEDSSGTVVWVLGLGAIGIASVAAIISVAVRGRRDRSD